MPEMDRRTFIRLGAISAGALASAYALGKYVPLLKERQEPVVDAEPPELLPGEDYFPTTCWVGSQACGVQVRRYNGRMLKLEGHIMHPRNSGKLCPKGQAQLLGVYDPHRVKAPLVRINEKGVPGRFKEVSWSEALGMVGSKVREARARDPRLVVWQKGRSDELQNVFDEAFTVASGATLLAVDALNSGAGRRAVEYTLGSDGVLAPDMRNCNYLISWGWNLLGSGGNKHCWLTHQQEFMGARERGMKVVTLDPRLGGMGPHTDKWLPIRPGTDLAFFLAVANVLLEKSFIDTEFMVNNTNAPFLVKADGTFLEVDRKEQVLDESGAVLPYDDPHAKPQLEGDAVVEGQRVRTAFSVFREQIDEYSPAWAASITGIPEATIQSIAEEMGLQALIGSKLTIDPSKAKPCYAACHGDPFEGAGAKPAGEARDYVYRPVAIMADHVTQQELGFPAVRAAVNVMMLLGAIDAVGGVHADLMRRTTDDFSRMDNIRVREPPYDVTLRESMYFPLNSPNPSMVSKVMQTPNRFNVDYTPEVLIAREANMLLDAAGQPDMEEAYSKFKFVAVIDAWLTESADHYADVVLPSATMEQYDGPQNVSTLYTEAYSLHVPPIPPMFQSRGYIDIITDLAEASGVLYGNGGYIEVLNTMLDVQSAFKMDNNLKPETRSILSRWAKSNGIEEGVRFFEEAGVTAQNRSPETIYALPDDRTPGGVRYRFYGASLLEAANKMRALGAEEEYTRDYTPLPAWREPTMEGSPEEYDLNLVAYRKVQYIDSRATQLVHMNELEPENRLVMNAEEARHRGIEEEDPVWVESHNAVTGDTRRVRAKARLVEGIRPDTVAMSYHYGGWVHPWVRDGGPTVNALFYSGTGYVTGTADQSHHVKVKVERAG